MTKKQKENLVTTSICLPKAIQIKLKTRGSKFNMLPSTLARFYIVKGLGNEALDEVLEEMKDL